MIECEDQPGNPPCDPPPEEDEDAPEEEVVVVNGSESGCADGPYACERQQQYRDEERRRWVGSLSREGATLFDSYEGLEGFYDDVWKNHPVEFHAWREYSSKILLKDLNGNGIAGFKEFAGKFSHERRKFLLRVISNSLNAALSTAGATVDGKGKTDPFGRMDTFSDSADVVNDASPGYRAFFYEKKEFSETQTLIYFGPQVFK